MKAPRLIIQGLNNGSSVVGLIKDIATKAKYKRVTGVFAYATAAGVKLLIDALRENTKGWNEIEKRWVVSIDYARTEPEALKKLVGLNNSFVRVPFFEAIMKNKFKPKRNFHPKTILFDSRRGVEIGPVGIVVGSGNLSISGLSLGYESAISINWANRISKKDRDGVKSIITEIDSIGELFDIATPITISMINAYQAKRPKIKHDLDDEVDEVKTITKKKTEVDVAKAIALKTSTHFWIDVRYVVPNLGKGKPGNQIDMQRGSRTFFGFSPEIIKRNASLGDIAIQYDDKTATCHMRFGNNYMDKLNLPIPGEDGPATYQNKTILFEKQKSGSFLLSVGSKSDIAYWKKLSQRRRTLYKMQGGREYGVF